MSQPRSWTCDTCQRLITNPSWAVLVASSDEQSRASDFRIVHKGPCDPGPDHGLSWQVVDLLGPDGPQYLLSLLAPGLAQDVDGWPLVADLASFVDVWRRLYTPWYEQARPALLRAADAGTLNPVDLYTQEDLRTLANGQDLP